MKILTHNKAKIYSDIGKLKLKKMDGTDFIYEPSKHVPFRDKKVLERVRKIKREEIENHPNPDYKIRIVPDADLSIISLFDAFHRIKTAADNNEPLVMIMPNPWPQFRMLAHMLNKFHVDCHKLHTFNMDEYADQDGNIAPESWNYGFGYAFIGCKKCKGNAAQLQHLIINLGTAEKHPMGG